MKLVDLQATYIEITIELNRTQPEFYTAMSMDICVA